VIAQHRKHGSTPPHFVDYTLRPDGTGWDEYKKRLQPDPGRIPTDLDAQIRLAQSVTDQPISINTGSLVGWVRDWLGVEGLAYLCADNLDLYQEMVETITSLVLWELDYMLPRFRGRKPDCGWCWEDICFRNGPLINPTVFQQICVPNYQRISQKLYDHGVKFHVVDSDGMIEDLAGLWLEGGVNVMHPVEVGAWNYDPMTLRRKFGRNLLMYGGIDKMALTKGRAAIDAEIARRVPLMKEGGFVPLPDHMIVPGTPLEDYRYYLKKLAEVRL
jgi:uroporphyrinogen decarboxylase